jgi:3-oxoadipate enol-lactonase
VTVTAGATSAQAPPAPAAVTAGGVAENDGVWISWRAHGEGEPVLMIMGFMGSSRAWFRLLPHVSSQRRAIVFDNRGTGDSDRPPGLWTMRDMAADGLSVLDAAGVESAHVIGASMGGMIAQHLALEAPERVRSLILCATHPGRRPGPPPWRMLASIAARPVLGSGRTFRVVAPLLYSERTRREHPERLEADMRMRAEDLAPAATAPAQAAAIASHDTRDRLGGLRMPVLVLHGEEDALMPLEDARELAERIPRARLIQLPDCGHVLATDAEERVAEAVGSFLDEVGDTPPDR